ncbi:hypothetical protein [Actinokineospora sp. NBRC 105648]|uniref:hypothetical protein n=1 Tax=Actinokineospora sp. NBRC 105648 TaxID=3032206 RepID=UPI0024A0A1F9|nr:hypothetical protein [Actinokineospora sp. NBRC 105648]GLZ43601.1 hypothetical protein Acsp05_72250 [Actinokineospora sp. NBRC 105648]
MRDIRWGVAGSVGVLFLFVGIWVFSAFQTRIGLTASSLSVARVGTAEIRSCSADPLDLWLTSVCDAQVRWAGEDGTVAKRVHSTHALSGTVDVQLRNEGTSRSGGGTSTTLVVADYPHHENGTLFFVLMMGSAAGALALGTLVGGLLSKLLPTRRPQKLALRPMQRRRRKR